MCLICFGFLFLLFHACLMYYNSQSTDHRAAWDPHQANPHHLRAHLAADRHGGSVQVFSVLCMTISTFDLLGNVWHVSSFLLKTLNYDIPLIIIAIMKNHAKTDYSVSTNACGRQPSCFSGLFLCNTCKILGLWRMLILKVYVTGIFVSETKKQSDSGQRKKEQKVTYAMFVELSLYPIHMV